MKHSYRSFLCFVMMGVASVLLTFSIAVPAAAQALQSTASQQALPVSLEGWLGIVHVDPAPGSDLQYYNYVTLTDSSGRTSLLMMPYLQALNYYRQYVRVYGQTVNVPASMSGRNFEGGAVAVGSITRAEAVASTQALSGSLRDIVLLCHFSGSSIDLTENLAHFEDLIKTTRPGGSHIWNNLSYGHVDIATSEVLNQRLQLPGTAASYVPDGSNADDERLGQDCVSAADPFVDFSQYDGVHTMYDLPYVQYALGGSLFIETGEGNGMIRFTWHPPFSFRDVHVFGHEIGHSLGLPHSGGNPSVSRYPYDSYWDIMSDGWGRDKDGTGDANGNDLFDPGETGLGNPPTGTIGFHLMILDAVPSNRLVTVPRGSEVTITLERLVDPRSNNNALVAVVPINNVASDVVPSFPSQFFTLEARFPEGYDRSLPPFEDEGGSTITDPDPEDGVVIIHEVDARSNSGRAEPARVVDPDANNNVNDEGAMWRVGETFSVEALGITVEILTKDAASITVKINNDMQPSTAPQPITGLNVEPNQGRPTITWADDAVSEYYRLYIGNSNYSVTVLDKWYEKREICEVGVCSVKPDINPLGGTHHVWMQSWGNGQFSEGGTSGVPGWSTVDFDVPSNPPGPIEPLTVTVAGNGAATFTWEGAERATWYNIWIGTGDTGTPPWQQHLFDWMLAENLGCENAGVCTLEAGVPLAFGGTYNLSLPSGTYIWYVQSWGPGGFSTGGIVEAPSWAQAPEFTVP